MNDRLTRRDLVWGYLAQLMNLAGGILLLPLLVLHLSSEEVGLWFVFLTMVSLAQLIELGLQPTLARSAAYVYSGVDDLRREGLMSANAGATVDISLLRRLVRTGRKAYRVVGLTVALLLFVGGGTYVAHLQAANTGVIHDALPAWLAYAGGFVISAYLGYYNAFILGRGDIVQNNKVVVATKGSFFILGAAAVILGFGLIGLGAASLLSCITSRVLARHYYLSGRHSLDSRHGSAKQAPSLMAALWPNAWKLSVVQLGSFLIVRANTLVASTFMGLALVASYGLTVQLLLVLSGVASLLVTLQLPRMNAAQVRSDRAQLQRAFGLAVVSSWLLFAIGTFALAWLGNAALDLMGKNISLLDAGVLSALMGIAFLEMNHSIAAMYLTTLNRVPFAGAAVISGVAIVTLSSILCGWLGMGVWGLVLAQGLVQLGYNNWKWPLEALRDLQIGPGRLLRLGFAELGHVIHGR